MSNQRISDFSSRGVRSPRARSTGEVVRILRNDLRVPVEPGAEILAEVVR